MRWLILVFIGLLAVSGCGPAASAPTASATAATDATSKGPTLAAPTAAPAPKAAQPAAASTNVGTVADGIRVTVDGKTFDVAGEVQITQRKVSGVTVLNIGKNASPSALTGGNGVLLEMQTMPGKDEFTTANIGTITFTVWKGVDFSYMSSGALPGRPIDTLILSQSGGKLVGSYGSNLNGTLGKMQGKIEFSVLLPK